MIPYRIDSTQSELFMNRLSSQLNPKDPLFILANQIDWIFFEEAFGCQYNDGPGQQPAKTYQIDGWVNDVATHAWVIR